MNRFFLCCFILMLSSHAYAETDFVVEAEAKPTTSLSIQNDFIKITVNNEAFDTGRFAVSTIEGDPKNESDNNKQLIYGLPKPWTSYTTIQIDGKDYIFGGPTKKRAGKSGLYGTVVEQKSQKDIIFSTTQFGQISATQQLSFFRNPLTRVKDTALIAYVIQNNDEVSHTIGVRIMMDTMLGLNDGAPFRIGNHAIEAEAAFSGTDILDYWQTFDNLSTPNIIAQGTLKIDESGIEPPDRMILANWGTLADHPWEFEYVQNRPFIRLGETEKDTALSLYYNPITLQPGESVTVQTLYGLGGVTLSPGELSLGLAAPAEIVATSKSEILLVGYVLNSGGYDSKNTKASFVLPAGFIALNKHKKLNLGTIPAGQSKQVAIKVKLKRPKPGKKKIIFSVTSDTLEANKTSRRIEILAPPSLGIQLTAEETVYDPLNPYQWVSATIKNQETLPLSNINLELSLSGGIRLPWFEVSRKKITHLGPQQQTTIRWKINITDNNTQKIVTLKTRSDLTLPQRVSKTIFSAQQSPVAYLETSRDIIHAKDFFFVDFIVQNEIPSQNQPAEIAYNPAFVTFLRQSPSLENFKEESNVLSFDFITPQNSLYPQSVVKLHFRARKPGMIDFVFRYKDISEPFSFEIQEDEIPSQNLNEKELPQ